MNSFKSNTTKVVDNSKIRDVCIREGYLLFNLASREGSISDLNVFVGGVYENGNISRSFIRLSNIGPFNGNLSLENSPEPNIELVIYNYLNSLIPGQYPPISGPFSETQPYYDLTELVDFTKSFQNTSPQFFCKILGFGNGNISSFQVGNVCRNGVSVLSENFTNIENIIDDGLSFFFRRTSNSKQVSSSNVLQSFISPQTETGVSFYIQNLDWENRYGISSFNGTNTFPTMGWAGARLGSIRAQNFQFQQDSTFNYPSSLIEKEQNNPVGIVYAGQGVQLISFPSAISLSSNQILNNILSERNQNFRVYQEKINNRNNDNVFSVIRTTGIQPYQQGRGSFEYFSREPVYNDNAVIFVVDLISTFPPEGCQPGRNNAFIGVSLTDFWSSNLNFNNQESSSRTPQDTRFQSNSNVLQTKTAHNAPLVYSTPEDNNNSFNPLPWNSLLGYVGTTTDSPSNTYSENTPILNRGITTMIVSGAYPLYRGSNSAEYSGLSALDTDTQYTFLVNYRYFSRYKSQYYITTDFWDPDFNNPNITAEIKPSVPVAPTGPYNIKGGRIVLYEGQRVIAGSYVYSTMGMTGNVNISKFFGPSAKEIVLDKGENDFLLSNIYSKYQSNQGGCVCIVVTDDEPVPLIPSNCQPIGIILEDIVGSGTPEVENNQTKYAYQTNVSVDIQTVPDFETTKQLQNQEILIQLFPMYAQKNMSSFPINHVILGNGSSVPFGTTVATSLFYTSTTFFEPTPLIVPTGPLYRKIKTNYMIADAKNAYLFNYPLLDGAVYEQYPVYYSLKDKEMSCDWPYPQTFISNAVPRLV